MLVGTTAIFDENARNLAKEVKDEEELKQHAAEDNLEANQGANFPVTDTTGDVDSEAAGEALTDIKVVVDSAKGLSYLQRISANLTTIIKDTVAKDMDPDLEAKTCSSCKPNKDNQWSKMVDKGQIFGKSLIRTQTSKGGQ